MKLDWVGLSLPIGPLTVRITVLVPGQVSVCMKFVRELLVVAPSPKSQKRLVIVPDEQSVNITLNRSRPLVGLPLKFAVGACAPLPVTVLVLLPPLLVVNVT